MKAYLAGSLFSEWEIKQRKEEVKLLRKHFETIEFFSPIEADFNEKDTIPDAIQIYEGDKDEIYSSNIFVFDLNNINDTGTFTELGMVIERKRQGEDILIIAMLWDLIQYKELNNDVVYQKNWGFNEFVLKNIKQNGYVVNNIEGAISIIKDFINKKQNV